MTNNFKRQVFRRSANWLVLVGWALYLFGGWVLTVNINYTMKGLTSDGWNDTGAVWAMGCLIAAVEAGISIFLTQPENWDDIYASLEELVTGRNHNKTPSWISTVVIVLILFAVLAMCMGAYAFDFLSTHDGLYPDQGFTTKSILFTLGLNFGTELAAFLGHQVLRMAKIVRLEQQNERMYLEPQARYAQTLMGHRLWLAEQQALQQIARERQTNQAARSGNGRVQL